MERHPKKSHPIPFSCYLFFFFSMHARKKKWRIWKGGGNVSPAHASCTSGIHFWSPPPCAGAVRPGYTLFTHKEAKKTKICPKKSCLAVIGRVPLPSMKTRRPHVLTRSDSLPPMAIFFWVPFLWVPAIPNIIQSLNALLFSLYFPCLREFNFKFCFVFCFYFGKTSSALRQASLKFLEYLFFNIQWPSLSMQSSLSLVAVGFTFRKGPEHFYLVVGEKCLTSLSSQISFGRKGLILLGTKEAIGLSPGIMHGSHGEAKLASSQGLWNLNPAEMQLLVPSRPPRGLFPSNLKAIPM